MPYRLPWVKAPQSGEWLGYWLLRIGAVYGMRLRALLALAGVGDVRFVEPTWARLGCRPLLDWSGMSVLLGEPLPRLKRMQALASPPARWAQLGYCPSCLRSDLRNARTPYWRRSWMDPYVAVCGRHRRLLRPIESNIVRPQVDLHQGTRLLSWLADNDAPGKWPQMTPQDVRALTHLQAQLKPGRSRIPLFPTKAVLLRRRVDAIAADLHRHGEAGRVTFVHVPRFGGWLAGVRDLQARQNLLHGVVRRLAQEDGDGPRCGASLIGIRYSPGAASTGLTANSEADPVGPSQTCCKAAISGSSALTIGPSKAASSGGCRSVADY